MSDNSKKYFDRVAHEWDRMRSCFFSEAVREKAFSVVGLQKGRVAADVGAGTGFITEGLVQRGLKVIAIDQSEQMLGEMKQKFQGLESIEYRKGEVEALPVSDEVVDYVFANMCLHHVESPPRAIKEMVRILKPSGKLIITDLDEHDFEFLRIEQHDRWTGFKRENIERWLIEAGLHNVRVDCVGENCCTQSSCGTEYAKISIFVCTGEK
jgi:ubiquinone/menaquinone biosynthesis C-methylase UbiE